MFLMKVHHVLIDYHIVGTNLERLLAVWYVNELAIIKLTRSYIHVVGY